jgi:zinc protease
VKVFVEPSRALPLVSIAIGFRAGSTTDPIGQEGLARITARMLRRGAGGLDALAIEEGIDRLGGEFGADVALCSTSVHMEVIARRLDAFVELGSKVLGAPTFDEAELGKLLRESEAEIVETRDNDRVLAGRALRRAVFEGHPYARRVSGTPASLAKIDREAALASYRRIFTKANAVVALSGDVTEKGARDIAERLLAGLPDGPANDEAIADAQAVRGRRLVVVDKEERTQTQMLIGGIGTNAHDADHTAMLVGTTAFGGTFTSRLMQEVRAKRGWSYGAYARASFDRRREAFTMSAAPAAKDAAACLALELEMIHDLREKGLAAEELAFVKSYLRRSHAFEIDTARKRVQQRLDEAVFDLPMNYYAGYVDRVAALELDEVNAALRARVPEEDLVVAVVATNDEIGESIAASIPNLAQTTVVPHDVE